MLAFNRIVIAAFIVCAFAGLASAQGNPTGSVEGKVTDQDGLALPGVTVTAASAAMQGVRTTVSSANGDYIIPFLPPGTYDVSYDLPGFQSARLEKVAVVIAETRRADVSLKVAGVAETVQVSASAGSAEIAQNLTVASTYTASNLELLPIGRTLNAAVLLAP